MKLKKVAEVLECELDGNGEHEVNGLNNLTEAQPHELSFLANRRYSAQMGATKAGGVIVHNDWTGECPAVLLRSPQPDLAFALAGDLFAPPVPEPRSGIHPSATVDASVQLGKGVCIGPGAVVDAEVSIGDGTVIGANAWIGFRSEIGPECRISPLVSIREYVILGARVIIHNGAVIGGDGFGYVPVRDGWRKIRQIGTVQIEDDVEIGVNVTIDRARFGKTLIGRGVKIDNLCQIGHNVRIGAGSAMAAQVGISGSTVIGRNVQLGGQAGLAGHLHVGDNAVVGAQAGVTKDVPAGVFVSGYPAMPHSKARRLHAHVAHLPELKTALREIEKRLAALEPVTGAKEEL